jgi:hypothetical protein
MAKKTQNSLKNSKKRRLPKPKKPAAIEPKKPPVPGPSAESAEPDLLSVTSDEHVRAWWLKPFHWKKGQSGNPGGRPRKQPITQGLEWGADLPCPPTRRKGLETVLGVELPHSMTLGQAVAVGQLLRAITDTRTASFVADRTDGPITAQLRLEGAGGAPLLVPNLTVQFVEVTKEGNVVRTIDLEKPDPIGADPLKSLAPEPTPTPEPPASPNGEAPQNDSAGIQSPDSEQV